MLCVLLAQGCSLFGSAEEATLDLGFFPRSKTQKPFAFRVTFSDGKRVYTLERDDFTPVGDTQFNAGPFDTATSGELHVACSVLDERGEVVAAEGVSLPLRRDQRYSVDCTVGQRTPYRMCFGCWGFEVEPLGPERGFVPGDSLFVVWSRNSISNPVLY